MSVVRAATLLTPLISNNNRQLKSSAAANVPRGALCQSKYLPAGAQL